MLSNVNLLFFSWFVTLPLVYVWYHVQKYRGSELIHNHSQTTFDVWKAIVDTGIHVVVVDVWFYATHGVLSPTLYNTCISCTIASKRPLLLLACMQIPLSSQLEIIWCCSWSFGKQLPSVHCIFLVLPFFVQYRRLS